MYSGINSLFSFLGRDDKTSADPLSSYNRTEDELRLLATAFILTLEARTPVHVTYHPYQPPVDDFHGDDRVAIPAHIDIQFRDPRGKTHIVGFSGHDHPATHEHFYKESDTVDPEIQPGYLFRKHTLNEALDYLDDMDPRWQLKHRVLVPA